MPEHIRFYREKRQSPRRKRTGFGGGIRRPTDIPTFVQKTKKVLVDFKSTPTTNIGGYDTRRLVKLDVDIALTAEALSGIDGLEFVDQDDGGIIIALASVEALAAFEERLTELGAGQKIITKDNVLFALKSMAEWNEENRKGSRLKAEGFPQRGKAYIDVELWSHDGNGAEIKKMREAFEKWLTTNNIETTDKLHLLPLYRVHTDQAGLSLLLNHRDVRRVDLVPKYSIEPYDLFTPLDNLTITPVLDDNAGTLAVLDTGVLSNHPLIAPAFGDAQSFITGVSAEDNNGHGTGVAGIALYGDLKAAIDAKTFSPKVRIVSGKVLDDNAAYDRKIIVNSVREAVEYFLQNYNCKVFNLSFGDSKYPYSGTRLMPFAISLDQMAREKGVLFIVSSGNYEHHLQDIQKDYPKYLFGDDAKVIDPATALNVITVGSIAEYEKTAAHSSTQINTNPVANRFYPSPFTRTGMSIKGALKPDFVDFGGNYAYHVASPQTIMQQSLGQVTTSHDLQNNQKLFRLACGTSYSAPRVSHLAARLWQLMPQAKADTIRAILAAHARHPISDTHKNDLLKVLPDNKDTKQFLELYGHGKIDDEWLFASGEESTTLFAEDSIGNDENHFYELPIPEEYISGKKRLRRYTVALSHMPAVRPSRLDYLATRLFFKVKIAGSIDEMANTFSDKKSAEKADEDSLGDREGDLGPQTRDKSTLQACSFTFLGKPRKIQKNKLYLAIVRNDRPWAKLGEDILDKEAYSIAIRFQDHESEEADLYNQINARLQTRAQARGNE